MSPRTHCLRSVVFSLFLLGLAAPASARSPVRSGPAPAHQPYRFVGTPSELISAMLPEMLSKRGHILELATQEVTPDLRRLFGSNEDFAWDYTLVQRVGQQGRGYTYTLSSSLSGIREGHLAVGVLEDGRVVRAFEVSLPPAGNDASRELSVTHPDGTPAIGLELTFGASGLAGKTADLQMLAELLHPEVAAKGAFDSIIDALQGVLNMLYTIRDLLNSAICVVNEAIEMMNDLNACPMNDIDLGTGELAQAIICLVQDVIEFTQEVPYCI